MGRVGEVALGGSDPQGSDARVYNPANPVNYLSSLTAWTVACSALYSEEEVRRYPFSHQIGRGAVAGH